MAQKTPSPGLKPGPSRQMLRRTLFLMAVFGIGAFLLLLARLYKLQIIDHEKYESMAIEQQLRSVPSSAMRAAPYTTPTGTPWRSAPRWTMCISAPRRSRCTARTGT